MMQQLKNYLKKYHEANLWLEQANIREGKKEALQVITEAYTTVEPVYEPIINKSQVVFSHYDVGHNEEETNRIQELYRELGSMFTPQNLAGL